MRALTFPKVCSHPNTISSHLLLPGAPCSIIAPTLCPHIGPVFTSVSRFRAFLGCFFICLFVYRKLKDSEYFPHCIAVLMCKALTKFSEETKGNFWVMKKICIGFIMFKFNLH